MRIWASCGKGKAHNSSWPSACLPDMYNESKAIIVGSGFYWLPLYWETSCFSRFCFPGDDRMIVRGDCSALSRYCGLLQRCLMWRSMCNAKTRHYAFEVVLLLFSVCAVRPGVFGLECN